MCKRWKSKRGSKKKNKLRRLAINELLLTKNDAATKNAIALGALTEEEAKIIKLDVATFLNLKFIKQAVTDEKIDINTLKYIHELTGESPLLKLKERELELKTPKPSEKTEKWRGLPAKVIGKAFFEIYHDILKQKYAQYNFKGGRGSLKSSFCSLNIIDEIMTDPTACALCVRHLKDDIGRSVYSQIVWAIDFLGLTNEFYCIKSPYEIKRISTGQIIYFGYAKDPDKIKSIRPPVGMKITRVWIEEADQISGEPTLRNIKQSAFRGLDYGALFLSYNVPISPLHWINKADRETRERRLLHQSHYSQVPFEWLGKSFFDEAEDLKKNNPKAYEHEYNGVATGTGANVFENVTMRRITDEEIATFSRFYYGLDFGYYPHPNHFVQMSYNANQRKLYIFGEYRSWKQTNPELADGLKQFEIDGKIIADSAEQKTIADLCDHGLNVWSAKKGAGSVHAGIKWLQQRVEIVIDNERCPHTAEEFSTYEYERTKDGEITSGYPDKNDHAIDAVRYGMNELWISKGNY